MIRNGSQLQEDVSVIPGLHWAAAKERKGVEDTWTIVTFPSFDFLKTCTRFFFSFPTSSEPLPCACLMNEWINNWVLGCGDAAVAKNHHILHNKEHLSHMASPKKMLPILGNYYPDNPNAPILSDMSDIFIFFKKQNIHKNKKWSVKNLLLSFSIFLIYFWSMGKYLKKFL